MTDEPAEWLQWASKEVHIDEEQSVWADQFDVNVHDKEKLDSTMDMEEKSLLEASHENVPCSRCFPQLHSFYETYRNKQLQK